MDSPNNTTTTATTTPNNNDVPSGEIDSCSSCSCSSVSSSYSNASSVSSCSSSAANNNNNNSNHKKRKVLNLRIKSFKDVQVQLDCHNDDDDTPQNNTIAHVKQVVRNALGPQAQNRYLRLICKGRLLAPDTSPLEEFSIQNNDVIHAVLAAPGMKGGQQAALSKGVNHITSNNNNASATSSNNNMFSGSGNNNNNVGRFLNSTRRRNNNTNANNNNNSNNNTTTTATIGGLRVTLGRSNSNDVFGENSRRRNVRRGNNNNNANTRMGVGIGPGGRIIRLPNHGDDTDDDDELNQTDEDDFYEGDVELGRQQRLRLGFDRLRISAGFSRAEVTAVRAYFSRQVDQWIQTHPEAVAQIELANNNYYNNNHNSASTTTSPPTTTSSVPATSATPNNDNINNNSENNNDNNSAETNNNNNNNLTEQQQYRRRRRLRLLYEDAWMQQQGPTSEFRLNLNQSLFQNNFMNPFFRFGNEPQAGATTGLPGGGGGGTTFFAAQQRQTRNTATAATAGSIGNDRDFIWGFLLGFFVGFLMLVWVWMPTVPHKQKLGILTGISFQLAMGFLRSTDNNGAGGESEVDQYYYSGGYGGGGVNDYSNYGFEYTTVTAGDE